MEKSKNVGRPPLKLDKRKVLEEVNKYLEMGVTRIETSHAVEIIEGSDK